MLVKDLKLGDVAELNRHTFEEITPSLHRAGIVVDTENNLTSQKTCTFLTEHGMLLHLNLSDEVTLAGGDYFVKSAVDFFKSLRRRVEEE